MSLKRDTPRSKKQHSPGQEGRVMKIVIALALIAVLWVVFAPGSGIVTLVKKRSELNRLQKEKAQLEQQIGALQEDIDRLQNDPAYLEDIARRKYGLLKKNEKVYDFSTSKPEKEQ
jgi:cell division protein FtsB